MKVTMQTRLQLILFLLIASPCFLAAQISYESSDYANIGDNFVISTAINFNGDFSQTGPDSDWDYTDLSANRQANLNYIDPDDSGYFATFYAQCVLETGGIFSCNSDWSSATNLAYNRLDSLELLGFRFSDVISHLKKTNTTLEETILGLRYGLSDRAAPPLVVAYDNPDTIYQFPITYQSTDSSTLDFEFDLTDLQVEFSYTADRKRVNTVDGWGSLTTPFGTFENTLRMRTVVTINDRAVVNGQEVNVPGAQQVIYSWFDKEYGTPVMVAEGAIVGSSEVIARVRYIDQQRCLAPRTAFFYLPPVPVFDNETGTASVEFTNLSQNADSYTWNFGDGNSSTETEPLHTYTEPGNYIVELIACNTTCEPATCDTTRLPLFVIDTTASVRADFQINPDTIICPGDSLLFDNRSENAGTFTWQFGDGTTSNATSPIHAFAESGTYEVQLIAQNLLRRDTVTKTITVEERPEFSLGPDTTITNLDTLVLSPGSFTTYLWSNASLDSVLIIDGATLSMDTEYSVTVTNEAGCESSDTILVGYNFVSSTQEPILPNVAVFPNPANNQLFVKGLPQNESVRFSITTLSGKTLRTFSSQSTTRAITVKDLPTGLYLLEIQSSKGRRTIRFVKE